MNKIFFTTAAILIIGAFASQTAFAADSPFPRQVPKRTTNLTGLKKDRFLVRPFFDTPMRDVSICQGPDNTYYLTGTLSKDGRGEDFQNNAEIRLWKSKDLKNWEEIGLVFDLNKSSSPWHKRSNLNPDRPDGSLARGITAAEIHYIKGTFHIPYSLNEQGTGLLKSTTGKPEGPYVDLGQITSQDGSPSMFEDQDGTVYWIWGSGNIAPMKADCTAIAGEPRLLISALTEKPDPSQRPGETNRDAVMRLITAKDKKLDLRDGDTETMHPTGFFLFRNPNGKYLATCQVTNSRNGFIAKDTFQMESENVLGPYKKQIGMIPHGGQTTVFTKDGKNFASFYGADEFAVIRDRPSMVPLNTDASKISNRMPYCITQRGPWDQMEPMINGLNINDNYLLNAPDGYYYFAGSVWDDAEHFVVRIFRSKDLRDWEEWEIFDCADIPGMAGAVTAFKSGEHNKDFRGLNGAPMDAEIHYLKGNYYVKFALYFHQNYLGVDKDKLPPHAGEFLFKSKTGQALGPYEYFGVLPGHPGSFLEDDDGTVYYAHGNDTIRKMRDDMKGTVDGFKYDITTPEGISFNTDIGMCPLKVDGKYILSAYNVFKSNFMAYTVADKITGPWSRPRLASTRGAHGWVARSKHRDDIYYQVHWGTSMLFEFWGPGAPCIVPLKYENVNGEPAFRSIYDMKPEEARTYQDEIDRLLGPGVWPTTNK